MKKHLLFFLLGVLVSLPLGVFAGNQLFSDIPQDAWYKNDVESLKDKGIVKGDANGNFRGGDPVTRAEVSAMMNRLLLSIKKGETVKNLSEEEFNTAVEKGIEAYIKKQEAKQQSGQAEQQQKQEELVKAVPGITSTDHILGKSDAPFVLFEYSDFHCPFCKKFHPATKEFFTNSKGEVAIVLRSFPLESLHPQSKAVHEIGECVAAVGGNDAFWKFADAVFGATQENVTAENYQTTLSKIGVDTTAVKKCFNAGTYTKKVEASIKEATDLGIQGTPGSILKNTKTGEVRFIGGAYPLEALEGALADLNK
ncbi:MAG: thioredoxin domain-containing protein [Candidatus Peregrinibacteria bacterium]